MNRWLAALKKHEIGSETGCQKCPNPSEGTFGTFGTAASGQNQNFSEPSVLSRRAPLNSVDESFGTFGTATSEQSANFSESRDDGVGSYADWTDEARRDLYEERAAIMEYDGGLTREEAEAVARREVFGGRPRLQSALTICSLWDTSLP